MNPILLLIAAALLVGMLAGTGYSVIVTRDLSRRVATLENTLGQAPASRPHEQTGADVSQPNNLGMQTEGTAPTAPAPMIRRGALGSTPLSAADWEKLLLERLEKSGPAAKHLLSNTEFVTRLRETSARMSKDPANAQEHFEAFHARISEETPPELMGKEEFRSSFETWRSSVLQFR